MRSARVTPISDHQHWSDYAEMQPTWLQQERVAKRRRTKVNYGPILGIAINVTAWLAFGSALWWLAAMFKAAIK